MTSEDGRPDSPPASMMDHEEYRSRGGSARSGGQTPRVLSPAPPSKGGGSAFNGNGYLHFETKSNGHFEEDIHGDDADSNVQEGMRSELGEIPVVRPLPLVLVPFNCVSSDRTWAPRSSWSTVRVL